MYFKYGGKEKKHFYADLVKGLISRITPISSSPTSYDFIKLMLILHKIKCKTITKFSNRQLFWTHGSHSKFKKIKTIKIRNTF